MTHITIWLRERVDDLNLFLHKVARRYIRKIIEIVFTDLQLVQFFNDPTGSAAFEREHLSTVRIFRDRFALFRFLMDQIPDDQGLFLEFGVYKGNSINRLAKLKPKAIFHAFDSFVGLPEQWMPGAPKGTFSLGAIPPPVRGNVRLVAGFYEATLPGFVTAHRGETARFLHIDCDLYSSTKTVLTLTRPLLRTGTIILFDEYFNGPHWRAHEYKAFMEFIEESGMRFEYIGYIRTATQVAVRLLDSGVQQVARADE